MRSFLRSAAPIAASLLIAAAAQAQVGSVIGTFSTPSGLIPAGLGADINGNLLMTGTGANRAVVFLDSTGVMLSSWVPSNSATPTGVTTDGTDIYVADQSPSTGPNIDVYSRTGTYLRSFPVVTFCEGVVYSAVNAHLYVTQINTGAVTEYDTLGNLIGNYTMGAGTAYGGISHDPISNTFWLMDRSSDLLRQCDPTFTELQNFAGPVANSFGIGRGCAIQGSALYVVSVSSRAVIMFDTTGNAAAARAYGAGCPREPVVYEIYPANTMDVSNRNFRFTPNGLGGWSVTNCTTNCWESNLGANLNLTDDVISPNHALGFAFPLLGSPNGSSAAIDISSNGFIYLRTGVSVDHQCCDGDLTKFLANPERISALWMDLDPSVGGSVNFIALPGKAVVTYNNIKEYGTSSANSCQIQLFPSGEFLLTYQTVANLSHTVLAGYSPGNFSLDPGPTDLSVAVPFSTGYGGTRLQLSSNRPLLNANLTFRVTRIPANALLGAVIMGLAQTNTPLDVIGMQGCSLLCSGDLANAGLALPGGTFTIGIPNNVGLLGGILFNQGVIAAAGVNSLGVATSNGLELRIGN